jgi:hypothetical protein
MSDEIKDDGQQTFDHANPVELSEDDLARVAGGAGKAITQIQDSTNNQATTAQKAAEKVDAYIRS